MITWRSNKCPADKRGRGTRARMATWGDDRGSITLELAIITPVLLLLLLAIVQIALWFHARHLALAAAQEGARAARSEHATVAQAEPAARSFLTRADTNGGTLRNAQITTTGSGPTQVQVQVSGEVVSIVPGLPLPNISQQAASPRERFTTPLEQP